MPDDTPQDKGGGDFDVVMLAGKTEDGGGAKVLRARPGRIEAGEVRPHAEGKPILGGELVRLERREDAPALFDVQVQHASPPAPQKTSHNGPAQVATKDYRDSWERTFGAPNNALN
jgi:hypothetical protein